MDKANKAAAPDLGVDVKGVPGATGVAGVPGVEVLSPIFGDMLGLVAGGALPVPGTLAPLAGTGGRLEGIVRAGGPGGADDAETGTPGCVDPLTGAAGGPGGGPAGTEAPPRVAGPVEGTRGADIPYI